MSGEAKFKVGDKVVLLSDDVWTRANRFSVGHTYTVAEVSLDGDLVRLGEGSNRTWYWSYQFALADESAAQDEAGPETELCRNCEVVRPGGVTLTNEDGSCPDCGRILSDPRPDTVEHPAHYTSHPSGIECIQITEHMGFNLGNALKYIWRCDLKHDAIEDLKKAKWYIDREIAKRDKARG